MGPEKRSTFSTILDTLKWLQGQGVDVTLLTPDADGLIHPQQVADALRDDTVLVSLMAVNNELGTITDVAAIGNLHGYPVQRNCVFRPRCDSSSLGFQLWC